MSKNIISMFSVPDTITAAYYDSIDGFSREGIWQLCYRDLTNHALGLHSLSELSELCYNTDTVFPEEWSDTAAKVLEEGKRNLLNAGALTGKGVKVAVIDRPINKNHMEFQDRLEYIEVLPDHEASKTLDFHGMTCASLLCGSTCGVAPEAELVYFAIPNKTQPVDEYYDFQLSALRQVLNYNKTNANPIRVVSLSAPFNKNQLPARDSLARELEETGCVLIDASFFGRLFQGIDFTKYAEPETYILNRWQQENVERNRDRSGFLEFFHGLCFVPSARRTSASNDSETSYIHWSKAVSESWTIPHVAGAYALCLQVKPDLSFHEFAECAKKCPRKDDHIILDLQTLLKTLSY